GGWIGAAGALGASALLSLGEGPAGPRAGALVAAACLCWALDNHWTALLDGIPASLSTFWKGSVAGAVSLALGLATAAWTAPPAAVAGALAVGALCYGASIALYVSAAHALGATRAHLAFPSAPFFGAALSLGFLGERLDPLQGTAAALLAGSLALVLRDRHAHWHQHAALAHTHLHRHDDGHHDHVHAGRAASELHAHWHEHRPLAHSHPHWPDLHHRHPH